MTAAVLPALAGDRDDGSASAPAMGVPGGDSEQPVGPEGRSKQLDNLFQRLATAASPAEAEALRAQIRSLWFQSGSPTIDLLLARDEQAALAHDQTSRRRLLEAATHLMPDATEAWNRRAQLDYSEQRISDAVADLGHVLGLEPRQFDALEGLASMMQEAGRNDLALKALRQLKTIDPNSANIQSEIDDLARKVEGQKI